ncbi:MAG: bifunctional ornithine acetyltransferase/N-acetylglutamate synthase, partial [Clostridiales bacterium]|nr:bifunctional ornithine acetyltransferase/N-acetylglutamate synthase [Clostridiales bacterium]
MQIQEIKGGLTAAAGFLASGVACGLRKPNKKDVGIIFSSAPCTAAGVFTKNAVAAAPVEWCRKTLAAGHPVSMVVVNSGSANASTGQRGVEDAEACAHRAARSLNLKPERVLLCSTGVIGSPLPMEKLLPGIDQAVAALSSSGSGDCAQAIMTT